MDLLMAKSMSGCGTSARKLQLMTNSRQNATLKVMHSAQHFEFHLFQHETWDDRKHLLLRYNSDMFRREVPVGRRSCKSQLCSSQATTRATVHQDLLLRPTSQGMVTMALF